MNNVKESNMARNYGNYVQVIGTIWMPAVTAAMQYPLRDYDIDNMVGEDGCTITREDIDMWLTTHSGDFRSIDDFAAYIDDTEYPWEHEESECTYNDCMYPCEDE